MREFLATSIIRTSASILLVVVGGGLIGISTKKNHGAIMRKIKVSEIYLSLELYIYIYTYIPIRFFEYEKYPMNMSIISQL